MYSLFCFIYTGIYCETCLNRTSLGPAYGVRNRLVIRLNEFLYRLN